MRSGVLALLALAASGCAPLGPNYARPPVPTPTLYRSAALVQAESLADAPWWRVFEDPQLQALIREALDSNLDVRAAIARVDFARAQAGIAKSFLRPQVDGVASYTAQQHMGDDVLHGGEYGFQLSWELDLFGRIRREHEAAVARLLASEQGHRGVLVTLVGDVTSTYFLLRQLDLELDIARRTLATNDQTVEYFQNRLDGGVSNRLEVDRIRANRARTAASIPDLEQQIGIAENALSVLLGRRPDEIVRDPVAPAFAEPPRIPPGMPVSLLERRPDILQAEQLLVAANANVGAARAQFFPAISLTGLVGALSGDLTSLLGGSGGVWTVTPSLLQPVYQGGRLKRNLEAARAQVAEAVAVYQQSALNGYREVADALVAIAKLAEVRVQREAGVAALRDGTMLARDRYESGLASYIEILTADQQLFDEELLLAQTRGAEFRARSALYRALGGGWQP